MLHFLPMQVFRHAGVAFRPTIARGLALSAILILIFCYSLKSNFNKEQFQCQKGLEV
jgi:hypothetical protein